MPRLTNTQYINALTELFGPGLPGFTLEPDTNPYLFFSIGASTTQLSSYGVERYAESAYEVSRLVFADAARRDALIGCAIAEPTCTSDFIARLGRRLYRRPLTPQELERWVTSAAELTTPEDPHSGLALVVAGMLQSPHFIYRVQLGQPDPDDPSRQRYTSWEMADRLSALLWDSIPDEALLDAAARDELVDDERLRAHVERMLEDPRARQSIQAFFAQDLDLKRLDDVQRDPALYPGFKPELVEDMRTEARLLVDDIAVDSSGELNGVALDDATQLGLILVEDERLPSCMVKQLYHHANSRIMGRAERAALDDLELEFALSGYRFKALLIALALSPGFRTVALPPAAGVEP